MLDTSHGELSVSATVTSNWICWDGSETKFLSQLEINFFRIYSSQLGQESGTVKFSVLKVEISVYELSRGNTEWSEITRSRGLWFHVITIED